jgi:predicted DNA-binding transcriptional regulator YafY
VDRFEAVEFTDAPPGARSVDPADYGHPSHPEVRVWLSPRGAALAEREPHAGGAVTRHADGSGTMVFRCPPSELSWWAGYFLRLGAEAEVVAPPGLRARVHALACSLVERYSAPPPPQR